MIESTCITLFFFFALHCFRCKGNFFNGVGTGRIQFLPFPSVRPSLHPRKLVFALGATFVACFSEFAIGLPKLETGYPIGEDLNFALFLKSMFNLGSVLFNQKINCISEEICQKKICGMRRGEGERKKKEKKIFVPMCLFVEQCAGKLLHFTVDE
jgi:hypothetical protein